MSSFDPDSLAIRTGHCLDGRVIEATDDGVEVTKRARSPWIAPLKIPLPLAPTGSEARRCRGGAA